LTPDRADHDERRKTDRRMNAMLNAILADTSKESFWMPEQASTVAPGVDGLYDFVYYLSLVFFVLITLLLVVFIWKYRHREDGVAHEPAAGHSTALELTWTLIPAVLVLVIFYFGFQGFMNIIVRPPNAYKIDVLGQTWSWQFTYDGRYVSPDGNLHMVVNQPTEFVLTSKDVIHSFFCPEFRLKKDVVPGRYNQYWVEATKTGTFDLTCAEYCGDRHSQMLAKVIVHTPDEFLKWLDDAKDISKTFPPVAAGENIYNTRGCKSCHSIDGSAGIGPSFRDMYGSQVPIVGQGNVVADENYIRESILYPQAKIHQGFPNPSPMPSFLGQLDDWDIYAITAFQKSISKNFTNTAELEKLKKLHPRSEFNKTGAGATTHPAPGGASKPPLAPPAQ
jgi:cytochrome c oxidase subunit 2